MNKYRIYFTKQGQEKYGREQDVIYGYSETDALLQSGYKENYVESIWQQYL